MKKYCVLVALLILISFAKKLNAQVCSPYINHKEFNSEDSSKLFLRLENLNFTKNNEYSSDFSKGATWIGYLVSPKLVYYPLSNVRLEAGIRLQKYSGREYFTETTPIFSAIYKPSEKCTFILGTLNQNNNHNLSEPMFEPERYFTAKGENGIQMFYHIDHLSMQTWFNWEQFILKNDPFQERFTFGLTGNWQLLQSHHAKLSVPFEILFAHRGGEIDSSDGTVQTIGNFGSGLMIEKSIENSRLKSWYIKAMAYYFSDNSSEKEFVFDKGHAFFPQIGMKTENSHLNLGYWNAYHFASSRGSELFQSVSFDNPGYFEDRREMLTLNYYLEHKIGTGIKFGAKLDIYYDVKNAESNYATALYIRINGDFFLKKIRWN